MGVKEIEERMCVWERERESKVSQQLTNIYIYICFGDIVGCMN